MSIDRTKRRVLSQEYSVAMKELKKSAQNVEKVLRKIVAEAPELDASMSSINGLIQSTIANIATLDTDTLRSIQSDKLQLSPKQRQFLRSSQHSIRQMGARYNQYKTLK